MNFVKKFQFIPPHFLFFWIILKIKLYIIDYTHKNWQIRNIVINAMSQCRELTGAMSLFITEINSMTILSWTQCQDAIKANKARATLVQIVVCAGTVYETLNMAAVQWCKHLIVKIYRKPVPEHTEGHNYKTKVWQEKGYNKCLLKIGEKWRQLWC